MSHFPIAPLGTAGGTQSYISPSSDIVHCLAPQLSGISLPFPTLEGSFGSASSACRTQSADDARSQLSEMHPVLSHASDPNEPPPDQVYRALSGIGGKRASTRPSLVSSDAVMML